MFEEKKLPGQLVSVHSKDCVCNWLGVAQEDMYPWHICEVHQMVIQGSMLAWSEGIIHEGRIVPSFDSRQILVSQQREGPRAVQL